MSIDSTRSHEGDNTSPSPQRSLSVSHDDSIAKKFRGSTIVRAKALTHVATQVTADTLGITPDNIKVSIRDDQSQLGFSLETPIAESDVERCSVRDDMTVFSLCEQARQTITERTAHITGHSIGDVDMIIAGVEKRPHHQRRVK